MHLIGTENQAKAPTHVKEKPLKVCIISHSSRDEIYSYGYGATRVIAYALKSNSRAVFSFFDLKAGYGGAAQDLELIYNEQPDVLGLSVFIWNIKRVESILSEIRTRMPQIIVVLGGAERPRLRDPFHAALAAGFHRGRRGRTSFSVTFRSHFR